MFTTMTSQLSTPTLLRLIDYLQTRSGSKDISEALNTALEFWLDAKNQVQFARSFARTARNAWFDLSVRRPGDKHFKHAGRHTRRSHAHADRPHCGGTQSPRGRTSRAEGGRS